MSRDDGGRRHATFRELPSLLRPQSLVILNDTRVFPARLLGHKATGGGVEALLVRQVAARPAEAGTWVEDWDVLARALGPSPVGARLTFGPDLDAEILERGERGATRLRFFGRSANNLVALAERIGVIPLPPYIESARKREDAPARPDRADDRERYQTVFATETGAVAAPTAGLHFTEPLLAAVAAAGHDVARITLHVGPGTFRPVEVDDVRAHRMDRETFHVSEAAAAAIENARAAKRPIVAVGTTVVRTLEALAATGPIRPGPGDTDLFLYPGAAFRVVTDLITNFHLPRSTLLMLVAAFAGRENVLAAYEDAIARDYRFYSYGDAMFITPGGPRS